MHKHSKEGPHKAIIEKIFPEGPHGPYILTTCSSQGVLGEIIVTASLDGLIWDQDGPPPKPEEIEEGTYVLLYDITQKRGGWRAKKFKFFRIENEIGKEEKEREEERGKRN